ncbi:MAG: hypothetical protein AAF684_11665, partial [Pseudomonadota bacterium]
DARVNGAPLSGAAARALETSPTRRIVVTAPGCEAAELAVDGPLDAEGVIAALTAMGVIESRAGSLTVRSGSANLAAFGDRLRCRDGAQATTSADGSFAFDSQDGVDLTATGRFAGDDVEAAPRFQSFASAVEGDGPIDAGRVRPGSGFFRAQLGVYDSYPAAVAAWRALLDSRGDVFRGEPVVVQPFAGSFRLNVLRRSLIAAETFCGDAKRAGALICVVGPY